MHCVWANTKDPMKRLDWHSLKHFNVRWCFIDCSNGLTNMFAGYALVCTANRMDWLAGSRALPANGAIAWNQRPAVADIAKHRSKRFRALALIILLSHQSGNSVSQWTQWTNRKIWSEANERNSNNPWMVHLRTRRDRFATNVIQCVLIHMFSLCPKQISENGHCENRNNYWNSWMETLFVCITCWIWRRNLIICIPISNMVSKYKTSTSASLEHQPQSLYFSVWSIEVHV